VIASNVLEQQFWVEMPNEAWVTDIRICTDSCWYRRGRSTLLCRFRNSILMRPDQ
jgi:hypothetical protein